MGSTTFRLGLKIVVPGVAFDVLRPEPDVRPNSVRFVQTVGGRAGFRRRGGQRQAVLPHQFGDGVDDAGADDRHRRHVVPRARGASAFPRHWVYDQHGSLAKKSGTVDFKSWYREAHGDNTPWGDEESDAFVTAAESALERQISRDLLTTGIDFERRTLEPADTLVEQGEPGGDLYLLLDGVLAVIVDGDEVAGDRARRDRG